MHSSGLRGSYLPCSGELELGVDQQPLLAASCHADSELILILHCAGSSACLMCKPRPTQSQQCCCCKTSAATDKAGEAAAAVLPKAACRKSRSHQAVLSASPSPALMCVLAPIFSRVTLLMGGAVELLLRLLSASPVALKQQAPRVAAAITGTLLNLVAGAQDERDSSATKHLFAKAGGLQAGCKVRHLDTE